MTHWEPVFDRDADCTTLNLILSPGRVATTSLYLWCNRAGVKTYKTHTSDQRMARDIYRDRIRDDLKIPFFLEQSRHVLGRAFKVADPVRIVLPTRDPLARTLSAFRRFVAGGRVALPEDSPPEVLARALEAEIPADRLDVWLERNLDPLWPLPETGALLQNAAPMRRHDAGRFRFLLLRSEMEDDAICAALSDFLGHEIVPLARDETAQAHNATIAPALRTALAGLPGALSPAYLQALNSSRYARLFYPERGAPDPDGDPAP